ncbi:MAG: hypothetical protein V4591_10950 [Bdellovibrionota bacterium]
MFNLLPVYNEDGDFDFKKLTDMVGVTDKELTKILKISESTIKRNKTSLQTRMKSRNLLYILNLLSKITHNDKAKIKSWLHEPRPEWNGLTPLSLVNLGKEQGVIEYLNEIVNDDLMGT